MERGMLPRLYTILDLSDPKIKKCYSLHGLNALSDLFMVLSVKDDAAIIPGDKKITVLELDRVGRPFPGARRIRFDSSSVVHELARVVEL